MLDKLKSSKIFANSKLGQEAVNEMELMFGYLSAIGSLEHFSFDLSLARGLDYYTGMIFEVVLQGGQNIGSISGGGRYDNLVGMFSGKQIPAVGGTIGKEKKGVVSKFHRD